MPFRIVTGELAHESNTFSNAPTRLVDFQRSNFFLGEEVISGHAGLGTVLGGFIAGAQEHGFQLLPTISASATPMGVVTREAFDYLLGELLARMEKLKGYDGVFLALHGAMVVDGIDDAEGYTLREVRRLVGKDLPIISVLDLHANLTPEMVDNATMLIVYDTYPHVDQVERGKEAAKVLAGILSGKLHPTPALAKPPIIPPLQGQVTFRANATSRLIARAHELERDPRVITASVAASFPFADTPHTGLGLIVNTNDDAELARELADSWARYAWEIKEEFLVKLVDPYEAIGIARRAPSGTFVLADVADTGAGGTAGDGTVVLRALLEMGARDAAVAQIADKEAVEQAIKAGVGAKVTLKVGGKHDRFHGDPVEVAGIVRHISDGTYIRKGPQSPGVEENMGPTAVLEIGGRHGIDLILTSYRAHPADLQHFRSLGIEPTDKRILVLKSAAHYRAAFGPIATEIFEVDAPGICHPYLERFTWKRLRRPVWPLDKMEVME